MLDIVDGRPVVIVAGRSQSGNALDVGPSPRTTLVDYSSRKALRYALEGRDRTVRLSDPTEPGCQWVLRSAKRRAGHEFNEELDHVTIQVADGELKGWYLGMDEREEKLGARRMRRLIITQEPKKPLQFVRFPVGK